MNRASQILLCVLCALAVEDSLAAKPPTVRSSRPNIIFIYADDMGYGDCGVYNPGISITALYNLRDDLSENNNLLKSNPETAKGLFAEYRKKALLQVSAHPSNPRTSLIAASTGPASTGQVILPVIPLSQAIAS